MISQNKLSSLDIQVVETVKALDSAEWDAVSASNPFTSYRWYSLMESILVGGRLAKPLYILVNAGGRTVGRATLWVTSTEPLPIDSKVARVALTTMLRVWPLVICQSPLAQQSGLILPKQEPSRSEVLACIVDTAQAISREQKASFLIFSYQDGDIASWSGWPSSYASVQLDPDTYLDVEWPDFGSYLADLPKEMRKHHRRIYKRTEAAGVTVRESPTIPAAERHLALRLIRKVEGRHNSAPSPWAKTLVESAELDGSTWMLAEQDGTLVGCELLLRDGQEARMTMLGLEDVPDVYFRLGYEDIRWAIDTRALRLYGGSGMYDVKGRWKFRTHPNNHTVFMPVLPVFRKLGSWAKKQGYSS